MLGRKKSRDLRLAVVLGAFVAAGMMACGSDNNNNTTTGPTTTEEQTTQIINSIKSDSNIFSLMHWSNIGEVNAGRVARVSGSDTGVTAFANQMVLDHATLDSAGFALAEQVSIAPALTDSTLPNLVNAEQDTLQNLARSATPDTTAASGDSTVAPPASNFDKAYVATQVKDHVRTLAIVDASIKAAQNQDLRDMLQNTVRPMVAMHLQAAQAIQARIGSPTS
jgi:putative membrane protein